MDFIFVDREIKKTVGHNTPARHHSILSRDVFYANSDGSRGEYIGTLSNLMPELVSKTARDYRFFDRNGRQGVYPFKAGQFNEVVDFEEAKDRLKQALYNGPQEESHGVGIVKVILEGVDPRVPHYLHLDLDYYVWGVFDTPQLIPMRHLKDMRSVFYEARKRNGWYDIKDLVVREITQDLF